MVTIGIAGVLSSIAYPSLEGQVMRARRSDALVALLQAQLAQERFRANNASYGSLADAGVRPTSPAGHYRIAVVSSDTAGFELLASAPAAAHADYRIERRIDDLAFGAAKSTRVAVRWRDRGGDEREIVLHSFIAGIAPAYAGSLALATGAVPSATRGAFERVPTVPLTARRLDDDRSAWKPSERGPIALVLDDRSGAIVGRCDGVAATLATRDLSAAALSRCATGRWLLVAGTIRFASTTAPDPATASEPPLPTAVAITLRDGDYPAPAACFSEARKSVRYLVDGSLRVDDVAADATAADLGLATWDETPEIASWPGIASSRRAPTAAGRAASRCAATAGRSAPAAMSVASAATSRPRRTRSMRTSQVRAKTSTSAPRCSGAISWSSAAASAVRANRAPSRTSLERDRHEHEPMIATPSNDTAAPMREALALAAHAVGLSDPNPRVGCVIVGADGRLAGRGHTQEAGGAHAEAMALRDAAARGVDVRGATVFVTLEPCSHHGRTPPCADALVAAGVARVVIALRDPNPLVSGRGAARLEAAGIAVEWDGGGEESRELNIGFVSRMERGRPWLRLKAAVSLDGRTALADGTSQWITGEAARTDGHAWRKRASAVLTGVGTVREDNPRLDVRLVASAHQPLRVVVDSRLETPPTARILAPPGSVLLYAAVDDGERRQALEDQGAEVVLLPNPTGKVDLGAMLADLGRRGVNELHAEAGEKLNASLLAAGLVDELLVYVAPRLLGSGRGLAALAPIARLDEALGLTFTGIERVGADLRLLLRPQRPA